MDIRKYISSGVLESFVLDLLNKRERTEVEKNIINHPEIKKEVTAIENALLVYCTFNSRKPPVSMKDEILKEINDL